MDILAQHKLMEEVSNSDLGDDLDQLARLTSEEKARKSQTDAFFKNM